MEQPAKYDKWCVLIALLIFLVLLCATFGFSYRQSQQYKAETQELISVYGENMQLKLQEKMDYTAILENGIKASHGAVDSFETMAMEIMRQPGCVCVALLEGTTLTQIYPRDDREELLGKTLTELNYAHTLANLTNALVVEGPVQLRADQTGESFLLIRPIVMPGGENWGQAVVVLEAANVLEMLNLQALVADGYDYELWRVHPTDGHKEVIAASAPGSDFSQSLENSFQLPSLWTLSVIPQKGWYARGAVLGHVLASGGIAFLVGGLLLLWKHKKYQQKMWQTVDLVDRETRLLSHQGLIEALAAWLVVSTKPFALIYITIDNVNGFLQLASKGVQQGFLHHVENCLLDYARSEHLAARVGESNFVLAIRESFTDSELSNVEKGLMIELLWKWEHGEDKEFLTAECGTCRYIGQEQSAEQLLTCAKLAYYERCFAQNPVQDLIQKCNKLADGASNVYFGEYSDFDMTAISKAISRYRRRVELIAYIDPVLGIGNRMKYLGDTEMLISYNDERSLTFCIIDICSFSKYNELFSIATGDLILQEVTARLKVIFGNRLYRIKGDVFLGVSLGAENEEQVIEATQKAIMRKISLDVAEFSIQCRIGVCRYPTHGQTAADLLEKVQIALRYAKNAGVATIVVYNDELTEAIHRENHIVQLLKKRIQEKNLEIWYQPIFNLQTQTYTNAEALLRLRDDDGQYISAYETILIAEKNQMMELVGNYIFSSACHTMQVLSTRGTSLVQMQVNLSVQQLMLKDYATKLLALIEEAGIQPEQVALEVTETILMQSFEKAVDVLSMLKNAGVHIILDDFGSGYSSLNYLSNLPIDMLKIDRTLTSQITTFPKQFEMMKTIVQMAAINGICVVAEGVETSGELALVTQAGATAVQGYYYSKPLKMADFMTFL